ncbi:MULTISPECIES: hypothetical protein [Aneurinibacillus]|jgi:hypothetical protein|uniref:Uncharacterized protein n=1 Tax=Aneurinibacillus thermoaerophilus TaxID=143495 RepID=A0A1G7XJE2_ANETH|nr:MULTISPECIES: hypothetical protein [Aneurinibacillus]MED0674992.1 hypothetical protein [Aneurinibacillus thermoaerophilus]MED0679607.1 hypothetical protein [Aneurinibacillus thermoaerophilus]MED0737395.1 hypothetical protein [Aneurinibacillus thermoaerophilus]MED0756244.1 hypothetical protein [Aneurinibacillus thermoaerophilus]MED0760321.1 hypothetical protein [Aneurinibacillus thermoaerophilus]
MTTERERCKVTIYCPVCGERYVLRGTREKNGKVETGFKQCICSNKEKLHIRSEPI